MVSDNGNSSAQQNSFQRQEEVFEEEEDVSSELSEWDSLFVHFGDTSTSSKQQGENSSGDHEVSILEQSISELGSETSVKNCLVKQSKEGFDEDEVLGGISDQLSSHASQSDYESLSNHREEFDLPGQSRLGNTKIGNGEKKFSSQSKNGLMEEDLNQQYRLLNKTSRDSESLISESPIRECKAKLDVNIFPPIQPIIISYEIASSPSIACKYEVPPKT